MTAKLGKAFLFVMVAMFGVLAGWILASPGGRLGGAIIVIIWCGVLLADFLTDMFQYTRPKHLVFVVSIIAGIILGIL